MKNSVKSKIFERGLKSLSVAAAFAMLAGNAFSVSADVIYEPQNSFYLKHSSKCSYAGDEMYIANGYNGEVITYSDPTKKKSSTGSIKNGDELYIEYIYTDKNGTCWGMTGNEEWVPMDYLSLPYSVSDFEAAYSERFVNSEDEIFVDMSEYDLAEGAAVYIFDYPGSKDYEYAEVDLTATKENPENGIVYDTSYTDPCGYVWIYTNVWIFYNGDYDYNSGWMCLSSPTASYEELYPEGQTFSGIADDQGPYPALIVPGESISDDTDEDEGSNEKDININDEGSHIPAIAIVAIIIAVIIIVTAVILIVILKNSKKKKREEV